MPLEVTAIMLGVEDLERSKTFYRDGLGCSIDQDHPNFVSFDLGGGSSSLALYERDQLFVVPVVVGGGTRFFPGGVRLRLELLDERRFDDGTVFAGYAVAGSI